MFKGEVEVSEKIDGSQFAFGMNEVGEFECRSKGQMIDMEHPGMFTIAVAQAKKIMEKSIYSGCKKLYFYTEFLLKPKHNKLCYDRVPNGNLYLFAIWNYNIWEDTNSVKWNAVKMGIEPPHIINICDLEEREGSVFKLDEYLKATFETDSILGGCKIEGVVIKNYNQKTRANQITMCKAVRPEFREIVSSPKDKVSKELALEAFLSSFKTDARWDKAIMHLGQCDELEGTPKDIGKLIKEILRDLEDEYGSVIKDVLYQKFIKEINTRTIKGFAEYYIKYLGGE
jgi:hypothetical protein